MKSDSEEIRQFLTELSKQEWLGKLRSRWVNFLFHFSPILNAVEILKSGKIRCRTDLERDSALPVDVTPNEIIRGTDPEVRESVRLYFRPLTPTQYRKEGFRPIDAIPEDRHCRIPIFFLFDSKELLCRDDCRFSSINLAIRGSNLKLGSTSADLRNLDFRKIYSDGPISSEGKTEIIKHRNAEVIIPTELDLSALRYICCRSQAEKETLLFLLPQKLIDRWGDRILVRPDIYKRKWVFMESVFLDRKQAIFKFYTEPDISGPFEAKVVLSYKNQTDRFSRSEFQANGAVTVPFRDSLDVYEVQFLLDNHIAYGGRYDRTIELPF